MKLLLVSSSQVDTLVLRKAELRPVPFFLIGKEKSLFSACTGLDQFGIWAIGAGVAISRTLYARGDIRGYAVRRLRFTIVPDKLPSRHANIIGWPNDKAEQKILALELASAATLVITANAF